MMDLYIFSVAASYSLFQINSFLEFKRDVKRYGYDKAVEISRQLYFDGPIISQLWILFCCCIPWFNLIIIGIVLRDMYENYLAAWLEKLKIKCVFFIKTFLNRK